VFFPGSLPLYKGGRLVGGLGISGDGVEQDDLVAAGGATGFVPAEAIRADQLVLGGARLPFLKFPRNPFE
jgi:heme-degrading protein